MKPSINQQWLHLTSFDSSAPSGGATVLHRFGTPGEYRVMFRQGEATLGQALLAVANDTPSKGAPAAHVSFDLTRLAYPKNLANGTAQREYLAVTPDGYVSFTDSGKLKPFAVVVESMSDKAAGFDSRRLGRGDLFALTLFRPGQYRVVNELAHYEGQITVAYPVIGDQPYRPPEPLSVECADKGFQPQVIELKPAQGLIFRINTGARIKIDLTHPDDGPGETSNPPASYSREVLLAALERLRASRKKK